jgi:tRNA U38,U39,U40 pseudouridine synthase TruA
MSFAFVQDAGVHALSNVCHVDVERISKRKPGEVVCTQNPSFLLTLITHQALSASIGSINLFHF